MALVFDAATTKIVGSSSDFDPRNASSIPFTVGFWVKRTTNSANQRIFSALASTTANDGFAFGVSSGNQLQFTKAGIVNVVSTVDPTLSTWLFLAAVVTSTNVHFYSVNEAGTESTQDVADSSSYNAGANQWAIGVKHANTDTEFWGGDIAWGGVWMGLALTDAQLKAFAGNKTDPGGATKEGTWYQDSTSSVTDHSGGGHTGTVSGASSVADPSPSWASGGTVTLNLPPITNVVNLFPGLVASPSIYPPPATVTVDMPVPVVKIALHLPAIDVAVDLPIPELSTVVSTGGGSTSQHILAPDPASPKAGGVLVPDPASARIRHAALFPSESLVPSESLFPSSGDDGGLISAAAGSGSLEAD